MSHISTSNIQIHLLIRDCIFPIRAVTTDARLWSKASACDIRGAPTLRTCIPFYRRSCI